MVTPTDEGFAGLGTDKALSIAMYGESVAAYRYLVLAEKAPDARVQPLFAEMAEEEQEHKERLQVVLRRMYPDADFYLTDADKALVVVGPRLLQVKDEASYTEAMRLVLGTEKRTAGFYAKMSKYIGPDELRSLFAELAEEGADHHKRLQELAPNVGPEPPQED